MIKRLRIGYGGRTLKIEFFAVFLFTGLLECGAEEVWVMAKIVVQNGFALILPRAELEALSLMLEEDCRTPVDQVRYLIRREAEKRGYLAARNSNGAGSVLADTGAIAPELSR